jgi:type II secretory pathway pseudopilin PulG
MIEMLVVVSVFSVVIWMITSQLTNFQKISRSEASKLDNTQESREFVDQLIRDLHEAGYPNAAMFSPGVLSSPTQDDSRAAAGLISLSATDLWFEGDLDGDGQVESIRYTLTSDPANPGSCPCLLQRSQVEKVNGVAPMSQGLSYVTGLSGVINSAGMGGSGPSGSISIAGSTIFANNRTNSTVANDVAYAAYKTPAVFSAFDQDGNAIALPVDINSNPTTIASIRTIRVTVNTLGNRPDQQDATSPAISVNATARLFN